METKQAPFNQGMRESGSLERSQRLLLTWKKQVHCQPPSNIQNNPENCCGIGSSKKCKTKTSLKPVSRL